MLTARSSRILFTAAVLATSAAAPSLAVPRTPRDAADDPGVVDVRLVCRPGRGVAPLAVSLEADWYAPGTDRIARIDWDLDDDGFPDADGFSATHVFTDPGEHRVTATVVTREHGSFRRSGVVVVHSAMLSLAFDDGHVTQFQFALPTLRARGVQPTTYIVPAWIEWREGGTNSSYMLWAEVESLHVAGWDVGSHSLTHPRLPALPEAQIRYELEESQNVLRARGFPARHFAAPFGDSDSVVVAVARDYYDSHRVTGNSVNGPPAQVDPFALRVKSTNWFKTLSEYQGYLDEAVTGGGWLILLNHIVRPTCGQLGWCVEQQMLEAVLDYAGSRQVGLGTVDDVVSGQWSRDPLVLAPGSPALAVREPPHAPAGSLAVRAALRSPGHGEVTVDVPRRGRYRVSVHDVTGRLVAVLADRPLDRGESALAWGMRDDAGRPVGSGIYFIRLRGAPGAATAKLVFVR